MTDRPGRRLPTPRDSTKDRWAAFKDKKPDVLGMGQDEAQKVGILLQMLERHIDGKSFDVALARELFARHEVQRFRSRIDETNFPQYTD